MNACLLLIALGLPVAAGAADYAAWTHRQTLVVSKPGLIRVELQPALLGASRASGGAPFHDLRVVNPAGVETPYALERQQTGVAPRAAAAGFSQKLEGTTTVLQFQPQQAGPVTEIALQTPASSFIKAATLEASNDGSAWSMLSERELICRQHRIERLRIQVPAANWSHFRVILDDRRTPPVAFTGAQFGYDAMKPKTVPHPVRIQASTEEPGQTRLTLDLGSANILLGQLRLHTPEAVFQREVSILNTRATAFRLRHENHSAEELEIAVNQTAAGQHIDLIIYNGDSPPLRIDRIEATRHPVFIVFQAEAAGDWQMFMGNPLAPPPRYDIASLGSRLAVAAASAATAGAVEGNTAFRKTATGPEVGDGGGNIDLSAWSWRRPIGFAEAGVVDAELDPSVVAQSAANLTDLRVIRGGRQIPFLVVRSGPDREIPVPFTEAADAKQPTRSQWQVTLPLERYPVDEIVLESPTPLFDRHLMVSELRETPQGRLTRNLGSAHWQRTGQPAKPLRIALHTKPETGIILVATDNGDNPPLQLTSVRLRHGTARIWFRASDTAATYLYYGNPRAAQPRYDVSLVRKEFETAAKVPAMLGAEERLAGDQADAPLVAGKGSPWLWAALAVVIAGLLWIVARLLPKPEAA